MQDNETDLHLYRDSRFWSNIIHRRNTDEIWQLEAKLELAMRANMMLDDDLEGMFDKLNNLNNHREKDNHSSSLALFVLKFSYKYFDKRITIQKFQTIPMLGLNESPRTLYLYGEMLTLQAHYFLTEIVMNLNDKSTLYKVVRNLTERNFKEGNFYKVLACQVCEGGYNVAENDKEIRALRDYFRYPPKPQSEDKIFLVSADMICNERPKADAHLNDIKNKFLLGEPFSLGTNLRLGKLWWKGAITNISGLIVERGNPAVPTLNALHGSLNESEFFLVLMILFGSEAPDIIPENVESLLCESQAAVVQ